MQPSQAAREPLAPAPAGSMPTATQSSSSSVKYPHTAVADAVDTIENKAEKEDNKRDIEKEDSATSITETQHSQHEPPTMTEDDQEDSIMIQKRRPRELRSTHTQISKKERIPRGNANMTVSTTGGADKLVYQDKTRPTETTRAANVPADNSILAAKRQLHSRASTHTRIAKRAASSSLSSTGSSEASIPENQEAEASLFKTGMSEDDSILAEKQRLQVRSSANTRISKNQTSSVASTGSASSWLSPNSNDSHEEASQAQGTAEGVLTGDTILDEKQQIRLRSSGGRSRTFKQKRMASRSAKGEVIQHEGERHSVTIRPPDSSNDSSLSSEKQRLRTRRSAHTRITKQLQAGSSFSSIGSETASIPEDQEAEAGPIGTALSKDDNILTEKQSLQARSSTHTRISKNQTFSVENVSTSRMLSSESDASLEGANQSATRAANVLTEKQRLHARGSERSRISNHQHRFANSSVSSIGSDTTSPPREEVFAVETNESSEEYSILTEKQRILQRSLGNNRPLRQQQPIVVGTDTVSSAASETYSSQLESEDFINEEATLGPGAFSVTQYYDGQDEMAESAVQANSFSEEDPTADLPNEDITTNYRSTETIESRSDVLVEANLVDITDTASLGPLVSAKRDNWYRRNQSWLVGLLVLLIVTIILIVVLTTVDLGPAPAPTMSPTTQVAGIEADLQALILTSFPTAAGALVDESSPQAEALQWLAERRLNDPSPLSNFRVLQQYALATLFINTLGVSTWNRSDGWLSASDECTWYGVECEALNESTNESVIVGLLLPSNNVSGIIPPDLSILSNGLRTLDLSSNRLRRLIPSEIGLLSTLTAINLSSNQLTGTIPSSISSMSKLGRLDMASNVLSGLIPSEIGSLTLLRWINLNRNDLIEALPSEIGHLTQLEHLAVESNRLAFAIPTEIGRLTRLEVFDGGSNAFVGPLPVEMGPLRSLISVNLSNNLLTGSLPYQMTLLSDLRSLDLSFNLFSGVVPQDMGLMRRLTSLRLGSNNLRDLMPKSIGSMTDLAHLDVSGNQVDESGGSITLTGILRPESKDVPWSELSGLTKLTTLKFGGMRIRFYNDELLHLTNLEVLSLAGSGLGKWNNPLTAGIGILTSLTTLTTLREIDFSNTQLADTNFPNMLSVLTNLEVLNLHDNRFTGRLDTTLGLLSKLSALDVEGTSFTGTIPAEIYDLSNLRYLNLAGPTKYSRYSGSELAGSIPSTVGQLKQLRLLNLANTQIGGSIPSEIGLAHHLEEIHLHDSSINGSIPVEIRSLDQLRTLDVHSTGLSGVIPEFAGHFRGLERLDLHSTLLSGSLPLGLWSLSTLTWVDVSDVNRILGSIPSDIVALPRLVHLALAGVNLTGSDLPSTIGLLSKLQVLNLAGCELSGTIPPELFQSPQLTNLVIGGGMNMYGSLPSEIGVATNLLNLQISGALITGSIPVEIGRLLLLERLDLSNTGISGTLPSEVIEELVLLENLNLASTRISGSISTSISGLLSLRTLSLAHTDLKGTVPSEIALLTDLVAFNISYAPFVGTIPTEMANLTGLDLMDLRGSYITGSIPDERCGGYYSDNVYNWRTVYIECGEVECTCCECYPTMSPSASLHPSPAPSTPEPSLSLSPSRVPSVSTVPSQSFAPTQSRTCSSFSPIGDIGTPIFEKWEQDDSFVLVAIPFSFKWRGQVKYSAITASPNGVIILGDVVNCDSCGFYQDCCEAFPVGEFATFGLPRIALGQTDLQFDSYSEYSTNAYYAMVDGAFVVSYEGGDFVPAIANKLNLYFQVVLYPDGNIEMRWGQGFPREGASVAVGLEDSDIAIPASGEPFDDRGVSAVGTWPSNQCRSFIVTPEGNYTEYDTPTVAPSASPAPSKSNIPTVDSECKLFLPIALLGTPITSLPYTDSELAVAALPFVFQWRGEDSGVEYTSVTVSENGAIFLGDMNDCPVWCPYDMVTCCQAFPIGELSGSQIPRIAVAQQKLEGDVYYATVGDTFIISFEAMSFYPKVADGLDMFFQVALYADGRVELRWGQGFPRYHETIAAGLEDVDMAVPATGFPFVGTEGVTKFGDGIWPTDQCRIFVPTGEGTYAERF